jgi:HlyD family secretion protein
MKTLELELPRLNGAPAPENPVTTKPKPRRRLYYIIAAVVLGLALIATGIVVYQARTAATVSYVTAPIVQQDLVQTVSATGTVNPQNTISVGTQQSGTITEIDVDFNSKVHTGQVLARLDTTTLQAQLDQARAALAQAQGQAQAARANAGGAETNIATAQASARAAVANARAAQATAASSQSAIAAADANVQKAQSALTFAQQTMSRDETLLAQGYIARSQADSDQANLVAAQAALSSAQTAAAQARSQAQASVAQAQASQSQVASQQAAAQAAQQQAGGSSSSADASAAAIGIQLANVRQAQNNLDHAVITSPVDGTVIARAVSVGQTVAASFQTPTLFSIAQDLGKMEVDLAVGEPDIGSVKPGGAVNFTVLAYPNETFHGVVASVRKNPVITTNVVTYTTVVFVDNKGQKLLPGMTANATIAVATEKNAMVVPLAALSYVPAGSGQRTRRTGASPGAGGTSPATPQTGASGNAAPRTGGSPWGTTGTSAGSAVVTGGSGHIFVMRNGKPVRIAVDVDLVAGTQAAFSVSDDSPVDLQPNDKVIVGQTGGGSSQRAASGTNNPFAPQRGGAGGGARGIR